MKCPSYVPLLAALLLCAHEAGRAQVILHENSFDPARTTAAAGSSSILSNSVTDIVMNGSTIWLGTGKGLAKSTDGGTTWTSFYNTAEFGTDDVAAIAVHGSEVWVTTARTVERDNESLPEGSGIHYSQDGGTTWVHYPQPVDKNDVDTVYYNPYSTIRALGITLAINNVTFDIAVTDSTVWIASFAGMARKSTDKGKTWQRVILPPDTLDHIGLTDSLKFDLSPTGGGLGLTGNLNHRAFSVIAENDSTIWIGTAGGINKSTDGGRSWTKFTHLNQTSPISGNFVVALARQTTATRQLLWAATVNAEDKNEQRGVSYTADGGKTWKTALLGEFAHGFGFADSIVYAVTDNGIFRTTDLGASWSSPGTIYDKGANQRIASTKFYSAASQGGTAWFGGDDGIAQTTEDGTDNFGGTWKVLHAAQQLASSGVGTYAYPNPFSPDDEVVRIHYSTTPSGASVASAGVNVTIRIFDFGMHLVRTVIQNASRTGLREMDEIWNGKDDNHQQVANGVYFYQVIVNNGDPVWGKILVLQ